MSYIDWRLEGVKLSVCSCDYGCPCEFNGRPTNPPCEGMEAMHIEKGHFGDADLSGLRFGAFFRWPGPVHEGGGVVQGAVDERATEAQRDAIYKILGGEEQEPTTVFNIYASTIEKEFDPVVAKIDMEWDIAKRTGKVVIHGAGQIDLEPIKNPVTGKPHRGQIVLPEGFEFHTAELASSTFSSTGDIPLDHRGCYGFFTKVAYGPHGLIAE